MAFAESTTAKQSSQPYKYNGKELDETHGLNWYDYSARFYDAGYITLPTIDPHSENYYSWSPYVYVGNNPMRLTDPDGKDWRDFIRAIGEGAIQRVDNIVSAVSNPGKTLENALKPAESIGEAVFNAADIACMGTISSTVNAGQAIYSDLNGGDGSATGQLIGGAVVDVMIVTGKAA